MVTSVIELADSLYKFYTKAKDKCDKVTTVLPIYNGVKRVERAEVLSKVCSNANDIGLPLSVVEQLLKDTGYEQLLS